MKGVAISYVVMLILGVAVIALLGIWFVSAGGKFSGASAETACRGKALEFCTRFSGNDQNDAQWNNIRSGLICNLNKLGIGNADVDNTRPDCSKVLK